MMERSGRREREAAFLPLTIRSHALNAIFPVSGKVAGTLLCQLLALYCFANQ